MTISPLVRCLGMDTYLARVSGSRRRVQGYVLMRPLEESDGYKKKSRVIPTTIQVTTSHVGAKNSRTKVPIDQKQVVFYSEKYAIRAKKQREELLNKAADLIANPSKYKKSTSYGAAEYVKNLVFDKESGEILDAAAQQWSLDLDKIREEEKCDGYYAIVTSELDETDANIIDAYRGLWKIEESFKITKSTLDARPVYLSRQDHINAHFLICFLALTIGRLTEIRMNHKYPLHRIIETLRAVSGSHLNQNLYVFDYVDEITEDMNKIFGLNFDQKFMTLLEIRKNMGMAKKA